MTTWLWILLACAAAYAIKLSGYLLPPAWLENARMSRILGMLTIGLLAALTATNAFADGTEVALDARLGALVAAIGLLLLRVPFLFVVIGGMAVAAGLRALGWAA